MTTGYWGEEADPVYDRQQRLWAAAQRLDLAGVRLALAEGAPPEPVRDCYPHGQRSQSPLALAVGSHHVVHGAQGQADRLAIIDLLLEARARHPDLPPPEHALAVAFLNGDAIVLERLLPLFPDGVDTQLSFPDRASALSNLLMVALTHMNKEDSYPPGRLRNVQRLAWVLGKSPVLDCSPNGQATGSQEPMQYALRELASSPPSSGHADAYVQAVDLLIAAGCPLGRRLDEPARLLTATHLASLVAAGHEQWTPYLLSQVSRKQLGEIESRLKPGPAAALRQAVMAHALAAPAGEDPAGPRMRL